MTIGNASSDDLTITASLASSIPVKTTNSYNIGGATTGIAALYFGNSGGSTTINIVSASSVSSSRTYTLPDAGAAASFMMTAGSQTATGVLTINASDTTPLVVGDTSAAASRGIRIDTGTAQASYLYFGTNGDVDPGAVKYNHSTSTISLRAGNTDTLSSTASLITANEDLSCAKMLNLGVPSTLTISAGAITVTKSYHRVSGQGGVADDLDTISGGTDGDLLILQNSQSSYTITVKDATGNIRLDGSADFLLTNAQDKITLIYDGASTVWCELSRTNQA